MKDLGIYYASQIGIAPGEDPNWTQFAAMTEDARVGLFLPTLEVPGTAMALLDAACGAAKNLPVGEIAESQDRNLKRQLQHPVTAIGIRLAADGDVLLLNVGCGLLAFQLTEAAKNELAQLYRESD